jgi:hypothetical protein
MRAISGDHGRGGGDGTPAQAAEKPSRFGREPNHRVVVHGGGLASGVLRFRLWGIISATLRGRMLRAVSSVSIPVRLVIGFPA